MAAIGFIYAWQKLYPVLIFRSVGKRRKSGKKGKRRKRGKKGKWRKKGNIEFQT